MVASEDIKRALSYFCYDSDFKPFRQKVFGKDTIFAGGVWTWSGHCPLYSRSLRNTIPALNACKKGGVEEIIATVWHNGAEGSLILSMAGLAWYADFDYTGSYSEQGVKDCFRIACGMDIYDELMLCELPEYPGKTNLSISRALLYNDPLIGLVDAHLEKLDTANYYKELTPKLNATSDDKGIFTLAYTVVQKLSSLFENKADFGLRLKAAYDKDDRGALAALVAECDVIIDKLNALKDAHRASWMEYNKPFGWEIFDIRYGGVLLRFDTVKQRVNEYLRGDIEHIEELEAERVRLDGVAMDAPDSLSGWFIWWQYQKYATTNNI